MLSRPLRLLRCCLFSTLPLRRLRRFRRQRQFMRYCCFALFFAAFFAFDTRASLMIFADASLTLAAAAAFLLMSFRRGLLIIAGYLPIDAAAAAAAFAISF